MDPLERISAKQAKQLRLLNELSAKLQSLLGSEKFFQEIVDLIQSQFQYSCVQYFSIAEDGTATLRAQSGVYCSSHIRVGHVLRPGSGGIIEHVIRNQKSHLANDVSSDRYYTNHSVPVNTRSEICLPVLSNDKLLGVLNVESDLENAFDEEDVITLESVTAQVAVALSNRKLYDEVIELNKNLKDLVARKSGELSAAHERILQQQRLLEKENKVLKNMVAGAQPRKAPTFVGRSPSILNLLAMVDKIAPTTATVLIEGESGTGKELIARRLHDQSERSGKPFIVVNCGALQENLLESELFGHEKGAFTGAVSQKIGLAEAASGGTLFLDEIGEMSLSIQVKLLRFLQEGEFYRVGGKNPIRVDVRVISATNRDLEQEVRNGRFREDLYYRLNTITLRMPPLRERRDDIEILATHFLTHSRFGDHFREGMKLSPEVITAFRNYDWPGNIRELENTIERMKILAEGDTLQLQDVPFAAQRGKPSIALELDPSEPVTALEEVEKRHIIRALDHFRGNKTKAAHALGITIKTLYNKLQKYEAQSPKAEGEQRP